MDNVVQVNLNDGGRGLRLGLREGRITEQKENETLAPLRCTAERCQEISQGYAFFAYPWKCGPTKQRTLKGCEEIARTLLPHRTFRCRSTSAKRDRASEESGKTFNTSRSSRKASPKRYESRSACTTSNQDAKS